MRARVVVTLRQGVLDPAGQAVAAGLNQMGFSAVKDVRLGKVIEVDLQDMPHDEARAQLEAMGRKLLANLVIEDFSVEIR